MLAATTLMPGALFPLGFLLLSVALLRSREFPTAAVVLLGVGAILFPIGHAVGVTPALIGGDVVLVVAMSWIASHLRARPALWW